MTREQALRVLRLIARPYGYDLDGELAETWFNSALSSCDYELGLTVARRLVGFHERMPRPAHFNEMLRSERRKTPLNQALPPTEGVECTPEVFKSNIAAARSLLGWGADATETQAQEVDR